ncbi:conjugal transfer protein TraV [Klebsiella pneumoniae subsp. ozaenae]|uniref:Conjugal transfer protein TraV n=13 Tax=Pseudomonadota TaxID=1224 RepID=A0A378UCD9_KLEPO|nr:conjugal transfer protein TraV [Klebsiella pneumoniae subsp. ozaenae]
MNKLVSDGSVKKINYPVLYESGITPPLCEVSAPEPDAGGKRIVAYVYKSSRSTVFENPDIVKTCTVRDLKKDFVNCDEKVRDNETDSFFIPLLGTLLLSGCAGTSTEFECNATTSDTCMTMEQANEKAKKLEQSSEAKPVAASLPRLAEGNFRTMPVQTVTATTPSGSRPAVTALPEQKLLAPRPLFTAAREVKRLFRSVQLRR